MNNNNNHRLYTRFVFFSQCDLYVLYYPHTLKILDMRRLLTELAFIQDLRQHCSFTNDVCRWTKTSNVSSQNCILRLFNER